MWSSILLSLLSATVAELTAPAGARPSEQVGAAYELRRSRDMTEHGEGPDAGSASSHDDDTLLERVAAVRADGVELVYDLPSASSADERTRSWQFPARVFRPVSGPVHLLNRAEIEARIGPWLEAVHLTRAMCGRTIFTWNAFRIECDPNAVIGIVASFDPQPAELREGAMIGDPEAVGTTQLRRTASGIFTVTLPIDADVLRRHAVDNELVLAEIMNRPMTREAAVAAHVRDTYSGTITLTYEANDQGRVTRRTRRAQLREQIQDEDVTNREVVHVVERRPLRSPPPSPAP